MQKIKFIDGLRGWASLAVLIFHIFPCLIFQGIENPILSKMSFFGVRAVLIFFILSGFPLSIGLLKQQEREREREGCIVASKIISRYFRLAVPYLCASFIVFLLVKCGLSFYKYLPESLRFDWWTYAYSNFNVSIKNLLSFSLHDIFFTQAFLPSVEYTGVYYITNLWTMSVEFFGSLIVYIYFLITSNSRSRCSVYILSIIVFYLLNSYYIYFIAGIMFAEFYLLDLSKLLPSNKLCKYYPYIFDVISITMLIFPASIIQDHRIYSICLVFAIMNSFIVKKLFECPLSGLLGKLSFSLYLIHIPIIISFSSYMLLNYPGIVNSEKILFIGLPTVVISIILAIIFYPIDKYSIILGKKIANVTLKQD